ncbi:MAG: lactonase family protein [Clostridia bacterium]|nr:lactonase family protein [Clostridia bacterium]
MKKPYVYISSCHEKGGIHRFGWGPDGLLTPVDVTPLDRPMYTIIEGDRLYAVLRAPFADNEHSGVLSFQIEKDGSLTHPSDPVSTNGLVGCHLCIKNGRVYVTNYTSGSVAGLPDLLVTHGGSSVHPTRQTSAHTHFVTPTPDGRYLLVTDLGMDRIFTYDPDLSLVDMADAPVGNGPRHLAFSQDGALCYCVNELASSVSVYRYTDGALEHLADYPALPDDFKGENTAAAIRCINGHVYVSNRGHDSITCFKIVGEGLERCGSFSCEGKSPRDFIVTGDRLICTNEQDNSVTVFEMRDNLPHKLIQKLTVEKALCVTVKEANDV